MKKTIITILLIFISSITLAQNYEIGYSPSYLIQSKNLNLCWGENIFINYIKKRPLTLEFNIGSFTTTTKYMHGGELKNFDDDYDIKWLECNIQYRTEKYFNYRGYLGFGIGYYLNSYNMGEEMIDYFETYDIMGSTDVENTFGYNIKFGLNFYFLNNHFIRLRAKKYFITPKYTIKLTEYNFLLSASKSKYLNMDSILISLGYGFVF